MNELTKSETPKPVGIVGAGPAGITAAYMLCKNGVGNVVFEADAQVGGLAKTLKRGKYRCDIGPHRFFTKNKEVEKLWRETLADELQSVKRLTRIYYRGKFFHYPLKAMNALFGLGLLRSFSVLASYFRSRISPRKPEVSFEDWVSNRFGHKLFTIFFKTYTEKLWGIPCTELSSEWAAQRIRKLSLGKAVWNALGFGKKKSVTSLIDEFLYPRLGAGQMYEAIAEKAKGLGAEFRTSQEITEIRHDGEGRVISLIAETTDGKMVEQEVSHLVSSMPFTELALRLSPKPTEDVLEAARSLGYRSIVTATLILNVEEIIPDNWIYIHAPEVQAGRMQVYKNWSKDMVPDKENNVIAFEYFTFEGGDFWYSPDEKILEIAKEDYEKLGFPGSGGIIDGFVTRYAKAYPMYQGDYREAFEKIRAYVDSFENLYPVGRYGQFRYNNMDHSILTSFLAVRRLLGEDVDPWSVNEEAEYHEEKAD